MNPKPTCDAIVILRVDWSETFDELQPCRSHCVCYASRSTHSTFILKRFPFYITINTIRIPLTNVCVYAVRALPACTLLRKGWIYFIILNITHLRFADVFEPEDGWRLQWPLWRRLCCSLLSLLTYGRHSIRLDYFSCVVVNPDRH